MLSPTVYQTNVYAPNWILGNLTVNDVVNKYIATSQQHSNITNCPMETPFFNGYVCINCTEPNNLFNMETRQCTSCPVGTTFNITSRYCVQSATPVIPVTPVPNATHPISSNLLAGPYNPSPYDVPCPTTQPFFNTQTKQCVACASQYPYFN